MKPNIKKLLILNAPYLLFVWLFDKVGAAVRLSPGADASAKLLHLGDGFTAAFSSAAPSFHPADLALGIAGAVIVRLIIYVKGKNAKKYRKGMEYGSARWGNAEDIKPYTDPVFENNIPLTQTERLTMNSRPSPPRHLRGRRRRSARPRADYLRARRSPHPAAWAKACSMQRATCWNSSPKTAPCRRRSSKPCAEIFHASESHGENGLYHAK